jgi:hypothetical protein
MTLPNPGDMAKVVNDPEVVDGKSNVGKIVHVTAFLEPTDPISKASYQRHGRAMLCTALEPIWVPDDPWINDRSLHAPGITIGIARSSLRKIEPDQADHLWAEYQTSHDTLTTKAVKEKHHA